MTNFDSVIKELRDERDRLDKAISILNSLDGRPQKRVTRRRRKISAAGIARIRAAAKARWARVRAEKKKKK